MSTVIRETSNLNARHPVTIVEHHSLKLVFTYEARPQIQQNITMMGEEKKTKEKMKLKKYTISI